MHPKCEAGAGTNETNRRMDGCMMPEPHAEHGWYAQVGNVAADTRTVPADGLCAPPPSSALTRKF